MSSDKISLKDRIAPQPERKTQSLGVGVIGLGVGSVHVQVYTQDPRCTVKALCDLSDEKLGWAKQNYPGLRFSRNADEILEDPQISVVSIASYDDSHYEQIVKAIRHGKHLFVEKPVCLKKKEAVEIRSLLRKNPRLRFSSNLILRKCPRFQKLKQMIQEGELGNLYYGEADYLYGRIEKIVSGWRGEMDFYSVVHGGAIHLIDLLLWMTGDRVVEVTAYGNQIATQGTRFRHRDFVAALLKFESGFLAKVTANFGCVRPHFHAVSLYGTRATFLNTPESGWFYRSRDPLDNPQKMDEAYPGVHKGGLISNFLDSIFEKREPEVTSDDVFNTMAVCFAIEKSADAGRPVRVEAI